MEKTSHSTGEDGDINSIDAVLRALDLDGEYPGDGHLYSYSEDTFISTNEAFEGEINGTGDGHHDDQGWAYNNNSGVTPNHQEEPTYYGDEYMSNGLTNGEYVGWDETGTAEDEDGYDEDGEDVDGDAMMDFTSAALETEDLLRKIQDSSSEDDPLRSYSASVDAIYAALYTSEGDVNIAVALLLNAFHKMHTFKPCRHYMQSQCFRKDCAFSHNFDSVPCRYWLLEGPGCSNGGECTFLHWVAELDDTSSAFVDSVNNATQTVIEVDDIDEFPTLAPIAKSQASTKAAPTVPTNSLVKKEERKQSTTAHGGTGGKATSSDYHIWSRSDLASDTFGAHEWVPSGRAVNATYESHRASAKILASSRNRMLQEATNAYMSGQKDIARRLSSKGRELNAEMKAHHKEAAQNIFQAQNDLDSLRSGVLNVHGLHVAELIECLDSLIPYLKTYLKPAYKPQGGRGMPGNIRPCIRVITGSGHHTAGPQKGVSRLLPTAQQYCVSHNYTYNMIKDPNGFECGVSIML